jgi:RNA-binding protein YlmH
MNKPPATRSKAEAMLIARVDDMLNGHRRAFTAFLTEAEQAILRPLTARREDAVWYGGYPGAERVMLGVFPHGAADMSAFPILPITLHLPKQASVTHRDILGSLMALLISRDSIGDILVEPHRALVFMTHAAGQLALSELERIGSAGVVCEAGADLSSLPVQQYTSREATVSALRLDAVVAAIAQKSRTTAAAMVSAGLVAKNGLVLTEQSARVESGDKISIRGYGKALVCDKGRSKKGRIRIEIRKYL